MRKTIFVKVVSLWFHEITAIIKQEEGRAGGELPKSC